MKVDYAVRDSSKQYVSVLCGDICGAPAFILLDSKEDFVFCLLARFKENAE